MKKFIATLLSLTFSCSVSFAQYFETDTTYVPFSKQGKFIFCDTNEKILINKLFDYAEPFRAGYAIVGKKGVSGKMLLGVIDKKGKLIIPYNYKLIEFKKAEDEVTKGNPVGLYFETNDGYKTFNIKGVEKNVKEDRNYSYDTRTNDLAFIFEINGKYGAKAEADTIPPVYDFLQQPTYRMAIFIAGVNGKKGVINSDNEQLIPIVYSDVQWKESISGFTLKENNKPLLGYYYYRTSSGPQTIVPCKYKSIIKKIGDKFLLAERQDGAMVYINLFNNNEYIKE